MCHGQKIQKKSSVPIDAKNYQKESIAINIKEMLEK